MTVIFPFCHKEIGMMRNLLTWISELDAKQGHKAVLLASSQVAKDDIKDLFQIAKATFVEVDPKQQTTVDERPWPACCNALFRLAVIYAKDSKAPFFWCEPDCVPLKPGWVSTLETEYQKAGKPFMGHVWGRPMEHLTGCAVYPPDIARWNPYAAAATTRPWDVTRPELTLAQTHRTSLIHHEWGDIPTNTPWTFPDQESVRRIRPNAILFHRCKDDSLIARMREARSNTEDKPKSQFWPAVKRKAALLINGAPAYYHSGNLGDIMYALFAIKKNGGGDLLIGPEQVNTSPCRVPTTESQFRLLEPLIDSVAPYIRNLKFVPKHPGSACTDLNEFRNHWSSLKIRRETGINNLSEMHFYTLGIWEKFEQDEPWIYIPSPIRSDRIIVHRSARYRATDFPWRQFVQRYQRRILFVGLPEEHAQFQKEFGLSVSYYAATDFLDLAETIAGASAFVGNQSFPCSVALACGQRVFQESWPMGQDCVYDRPTFLNQHSSKALERFEGWL